MRCQITAAEQLLQLSLGKTGGDARASLAAAAGVEACGALASLADAQVERSPHGVAYAARGPRLRNHPTGSDPRNEYRASSGFDNEESRKKGHRPRCTRRNRAIGSFRPIGRTVSRRRSGIGGASTENI